MPNSKSDSISRRKFLKTMGAGAAAVVASQLVAGFPMSTVHASEKAAADTWAVLIDLTRCAGCNSCALACKAANNLPDADTIPHELSNSAYTFVDECQVTTEQGEETQHVKRQCMHCLNAACVSACPAGAMYKSEEGPVIYRPERCLGCRYCQMACPFGVPSFEWDNGLTPVISKCWMCYSRLKEGETPACVGACPAGALKFGTRDQLLAQAHAQIKSNPDRYIDHIFGEFEVGGTSTLYLSDIPFEELGFPANLPVTAPPEETEKIMSALPAVIAGMATLMAGTAVYTHRKPHYVVTEEEEA